MTDPKVKVTITLDGKQYTAEINRSEQKTKELGDQGKKTAADLAHLQTSVKSLTGEIAALIHSQLTWRSVMGSLGLGALTYEVVNQTKAIIDAGNASVKYSAALKAVTGTNESAADEMRFVREEADRLGVSFIALLGPYAQITAAARGTALEGANTRDIFKAVIEAARVFGLSADDTEGVLRAIAQMMSKGTVQAEELRGQLGDRLPGAFKLAAQAMGKTEAEFNKMLDTGQILAADMLPKLATELHKTVSAGLVDAQHSPAAEFERLGNALTDLKTTIAKSGLLDFLSDVAKGLTPIVEKLKEMTPYLAGRSPDKSGAGSGGLKVYLENKITEEVANIQDAWASGRAWDSPERTKALMDRIQASGLLLNIWSEQLNNLYATDPKIYGEQQADKARAILAKRPPAVPRLGEASLAEQAVRSGYSSADAANDEITRLNALFNDGAINVETYSNNIANATKNIDSLARATHDRVASQHETMLDSLQTDEERLQESYARRAEIIGNAQQQGILDEKQAKAEMLALEVDYQTKRTKLALDAANKQRNLQIDAAKNYATAFTAISSIFANESRQAFKHYQAFAIAESAINSYKAFTSVLADPALPTWAKIPAAASILAAGIEKVHQIGAMSPGGGVSGGAGAAPTYPANPLTSFPADNSKGGGATQVIIQGNIYGFDDFRQRVTDAVRDAVDNNDVVVISGNSRQAAELRG